jgi:DNA mismatch repair protein MSH2
MAVTATEIHTHSLTHSLTLTHSQTGDGVVRLFDRKQYVSLHGVDADLIAKAYHKSTKQLKFWRSGLACLSLRYGLEFSAVLRVVLRELLRGVELYANEGGAWKCVRKASPGNVAAFEAELFGEHDGVNAGKQQAPPPVFLAVFPVQRAGATLFGVAYADTTLKQLGVAEFGDGEQLANFESVLVQVGASECCTIADDKNYLIAKLHDVLERCAVPVVAKKRADFKPTDVEQDLKRLTGEKRFRSAVALLDLKAATAALACLVAHLELLSDAASHGAWRVRSFDLAQYMRLDGAALKALNLVATADDVNQRLNLATHLNDCKTQMGARLLHQLVKQPLLDAARIGERQDLVAAFYEDTLLRQHVREEGLRGMPDVERLCRKLVLGRASLQDLCVLYQFAARLPDIVLRLKEHKGAYAAQLERAFGKELDTRATQLAKYNALIASAVDLELAAETHEYLIKASYSDALTKIAEGKQKWQQKLDRVHEEVADELGIDAKKLKLEHGAKQPWFFRVSKAEEPKLRAKLKGAMAPFETAAGGVKFRSAALVQASEKWQGYQSAYEDAQRDLVERVLKVAATYVEVFEAAAALVAQLDVFAAWAQVFAAAPGQYVRPTITPAGVGSIVLKQFRHPCLEGQDGVTIIANDVEMRRGESEFHIITGANMGGKSTFIRSVGVLVLMAQLGCMLPAAEASVCICDCILARVGAGDSQLRGVSTFMSEMLETAAILATATDKSLIIIDELGRGTSTYDGFGLAWAISEHLSRNVRAFTFFATHFFELTALAQHVPTVRNFHVKALTERNRLVMLYRVLPGASDQSLGIHVAQMAQFPPSVVEAARAKAKELELYNEPLQNIAALSLLADKQQHPQVAATSTAADADENDGNHDEPKKRARTERSERGAGLQLMRQLLASFAGKPAIDKAAVRAEIEAIAAQNTFVAEVVNHARQQEQQQQQQQQVHERAERAGEMKVD